jgi:prepilin-type processing-associated H-X9-DG protein
MATGPEIPPVPTRSLTSDLAVASLACGIAGVFTAGVSAVIGLALGAIVLRRNNSGRGRVRGSWLAVAGIITSAISLLFLVFVLSVVLNQGGHGRTLMQDAQQIGMVALYYATEHEGQLPPADSWEEVLVSNNYMTPQSLGYSLDGKRWIAMNMKLSGMNTTDIRDRNKTVLFFECDPDSPLAGCWDSLPPEPRGRWGYVVCFFDGHVELVPREKVKDLRWEP